MPSSSESGWKGWLLSRNKQGNRPGKMEVKEQCIVISAEVFKLNLVLKGLPLKNS